MKKMYRYEAKIHRVVDGDTVYADIDLGFRMTARLVLRIRNLDTPEIYRPKNEKERAAGQAAKDAAIELLSEEVKASAGAPAGVAPLRVWSTILVTTFPDPEIYGRWLADITLPDERDFAAVMKELGHDKSSTLEENK